MPRHTLTAGPGQTIAAAPISLDREAAAFSLEQGNPPAITDGLVGWWLYTAGSGTEYVDPELGDCPLCCNPLRRPLRRPGGRVAYKIAGAIADPGTVEFMIDLLPAHLDLIGCAECQVAFTRPFVKEIDDAVAPR